jgi:lipoate-protein ligase A
VVLAGHKIAGSAQRRTKTAVLQHGSVLVSASPVAPELPGILDLADRQPEPEDLMNEWLGRVAAGMGLDYVRANLSQQEIHTAMALAEGRHERSGWLKKR